MAICCNNILCLITLVKNTCHIRAWESPRVIMYFIVAGETEITTILLKISPAGISVHSVKKCNVIHVSCCCNVVAMHYLNQQIVQLIINNYLSHVPPICFYHYRVIIIMEVHTNVYLYSRCCQRCACVELKYNVFN